MQYIKFLQNQVGSGQITAAEYTRLLAEYKATKTAAPTAPPAAIQYAEDGSIIESGFNTTSAAPTAPVYDPLVSSDPTQPIGLARSEKRDRLDISLLKKQGLNNPGEFVLVEYIKKAENGSTMKTFNLEQVLGQDCVGYVSARNTEILRTVQIKSKLDEAVILGIVPERMHEVTFLYDDNTSIVINNVSGLEQRRYHDANVVESVVNLSDQFINELGLVKGDKVDAQMVYSLAKETEGIKFYYSFLNARKDSGNVTSAAEALMSRNSALASRIAAEAMANAAAAKKAAAAAKKAAAAAAKAAAAKK